ncbi:TPA: ParA family protein [Staphylococcus aureus]|nr:ParA family protein [Staphylococcus aureus]
MSKVISVVSYSGGVGKTTLCLMLTYILSENQNNKILVIDVDGQEDVSHLIKKTFKNEIEPNNTIITGIKNFDLAETIMPITKNIHLIHGDWNIEYFDTYLVNNYEEKAHYYLLYTLLKDIKKEYDYIIFDTSPQTASITNNAIVASDYVIIPTEATEKGVRRTKHTYEYLSSLTDYNEQLQLIGIVPYYLKDRDSNSRIHLKQLKDIFEEDVFHNIIKSTRKVPTWWREGITTKKGNDKKILKMYANIVDEIIMRIEKIEERKENV